MRDKFDEYDKQKLAEARRLIEDETTFDLDLNKIRAMLKSIGQPFRDDNYVVEEFCI